MLRLVILIFLLISSVNSFNSVNKRIPIPPCHRLFDSEKDDTNSMPSFNFLSKIKNKITGDGKGKGGILNSIAKVFGQDKKSQEIKQKKQEINTAIDQIFKGTGLAGGILSTIAKGVAGMMSDSMSQTISDMSEVNELIIDELNKNKEVVALLGPPFQLSSPFSTRSSTSIINGLSNKSIFADLLIQGQRDTASASYAAIGMGSTSSGMRLTSLILQLRSTGQTIRVIDDNNSGGGRGGGGPDISYTSDIPKVTSPRKNRGIVIDTTGEVIN